MNRTSIEWTDFSSNLIKYRDPEGRTVHGCIKVSAGCANCYASAWSARGLTGEPGGAFTAKGRRTAQPGALNGNARLTPEQVAEIRTNSRSHRSLGLEYGVSKTTIGRIKRGTMWQPKGSALREWPS